MGNHDLSRDLLGRASWLHTCGDDHIHVETDQFRGETVKPVSLRVRIPSLDRNILPLDVPKLAQPFAGIPRSGWLKRKRVRFPGKCRRIRSGQPV